VTTFDNSSAAAATQQQTMMEHCDDAIVTEKRQQQVIVSNSNSNSNSKSNSNSNEQQQLQSDVGRDGSKKTQTHRTMLVVKWFDDDQNILLQLTAVSVAFSRSLGLYIAREVI
jgi:hypothetical protein